MEIHTGITLPRVPEMAHELVGLPTDHVAGRAHVLGEGRLRQQEAHGDVAAESILVDALRRRERAPRRHGGECGGRGEEGEEEGRLRYTR